MAQLFSSFAPIIISGQRGIRQPAMMLCREQCLGKVHHCPASYTLDFPLETDTGFVQSIAVKLNVRLFCKTEIGG